MRTIAGRGGLELPVMGQGTWRMGEQPSRHAKEVAALQLGIDLGLTLIDTAEMYADGGAEEVVAEAIAGRRDEVFVVSKVLPSNASRDGTVRAAEASLNRLRIDCIDLYLLHWPGSHPLEETYAGFEQLHEQGKIRNFGVSNFDIDDLKPSESLAAGRRVVANQVLYNLQRRELERQVLPWCRDHDLLLMAYSPLEQASLDERSALSSVASRHDASPYQIALAWTIREPGVVAIPKAVRSEHVRQNVAATAIQLTPRDFEELDQAYPSPDRDRPLGML